MVSEQHYVAVVDYDYERQENRVASVQAWNDWIASPIEERPLNTVMVKAKDEIEAFIKATKGETVFNY
jgi:hypothetical protein